MSNWMLKCIDDSSTKCLEAFPNKGNEGNVIEGKELKGIGDGKH